MDVTARIAGTVQRGPQITVLAVAALLPLTIAFVCSYLLSGKPIVKVVYTIAKLVQLGLPLWWVMTVERRPLHFGRLTTAVFAPALVTGMALCLMVLALYGVGFRAELLASEAPEVMRTKLAGYGVITASGFALFAAYHVVLNTLAEEYYWRWFFFARVRQLVPSTPAILLSSVAFTLHHAFAAWGNGGAGAAVVAVGVVVTLAGAVWARLYERSGAIFAPWISHMVAEIALLTIAYDLWRA